MNCIKEIIPYSSDELYPVFRRQARRLFIFCIVLLGVAATGPIVSIFARALENCMSQSNIAKILAPVGLASLVGLLLSIPASLIALVWCCILFFRCPKLRFDYFTLACLVLLTYYVSVVALMGKITGQESIHKET